MGYGTMPVSIAPRVSLSHVAYIDRTFHDIATAKFPDPTRLDVLLQSPIGHALLISSYIIHVNARAYLRTTILFIVARTIAHTRLIRVTCFPSILVFFCLWRTETRIQIFRLCVQRNRVTQFCCKRSAGHICLKLNDLVSHICWYTVVD